MRKIKFIGRINDSDLIRVGKMVEWELKAMAEQFANERGAYVSQKYLKERMTWLKRDNRL